MNITNPSEISDKEWDQFVYDHPYGNIFQTSYIYNVYKRTKNYDPIVIFSVDEHTGNLNGLISGVSISEIGGIFKKFSTHGVVQGGPLISTDSTGNQLDQMIAAFDNKAKKRAIYNEIRNMFDTRPYLDGIHNYEFQEHLNFLININRTSDHIWNDFSKSRRKNIRKAEINDVEILEINSINKIDLFYEVVKSTYSNIKLPVADISLFYEAFKQMHEGGMVKFYLANHDGECIGGRAILLFGDRIFDWYAGASLDSIDLYPNDLLVWHILKWGSENGYSLFDFGGAGDPNKPYGPREFKRRFGGEMVCYGRYVRQYSKVKSQVANMGMKAYKKLK